MTVHIALLRAVNVGGRGKVAMPELKALFAGLGLAEARTVLQTGNVVFRGDGRAGAELEQSIAAAAAERLGLRTEIFVRGAEEWAAVVAGNPFTAMAERDPGHLVVIALKQAPGEAALAALEAAITGPERVRADGRHLYVAYPEGIGRSRLTGALIERKLGTVGTGRNWNTVLRLAALVRGEPKA